MSSTTDWFPSIASVLDAKTLDTCCSSLFKLCIEPTSFVLPTGLCVKRPAVVPFLSVATTLLGCDFHLAESEKCCAVYGYLVEALCSFPNIFFF
ncbi:hypothetical protein Ae201684P_013158 [Aphanomyces euteiches]|uniref:Uncharacterized protein n=1 Tax=Aphanomyces euteiches TaxID=100861 RepID=A0A6G0WRY1_9STRA|nr:hypothetical protein Ae201684_012197 [Aphanomyces euteiches]KAH9096490.1 hypothetical protein Ae201684P_013158 [Aphanomyces euteiches]